MQYNSVLKETVMPYKAVMVTPRRINTWNKSHNKTNITWFHLYEVSKVVKFAKPVSNLMVIRAQERKNLNKGHGHLVMQGGKLASICHTMKTLLIIL